MRVSRAAALAAGLLVAALAGCSVGSDEKEVPKRSPTAGAPKAIEVLNGAEQIRAPLTAADELARTGRAADARPHLARARSAYRPLAARVRSKDPRLDREIAAAFAQADRLLASRAPYGEVERPIGALAGQLLQGAVSALVPLGDQEEPRARAEVALGLLRALPLAYEPEGLREREAERSFQTAFGLMVRAQTLTGSIADFLGPRRKRVIETLSAARAEAFPQSAARPARPARRALVSAVERAQGDIADRFDLPIPE